MNNFLQNSMMQRTPCVETKPETGEGQGQEASLSMMQPNLYRTQFTENGTPVMVTLNPYSSQLVDNLNKMMGDNLCYDTAMNPQLAKLTATLRKKQAAGGKVNIHENGTLQMLERAAGQPGCMYQQEQGRMVNPRDVVFRAVSPHGHVYWEINPGNKQQQQQQQTGVVGQHRAQHSGSDDNTNSDLQNISDFSDDDHRAHSEMSRQSSSRFSESRPLIYSGSSTSTSPGHSVSGHPMTSDHMSPVTSARSTQPRQLSGRSGPVSRSPWVTSSMSHPSPAYQDDVYAYAATDFTNTVNEFSSGGYVPEHVQSQVQIRDCRAMPVNIKSKEYIMAKIADYTERQANQVWRRNDNPYLWGRNFSDKVMNCSGRESFSEALEKSFSMENVF